MRMILRIFIPLSLLLMFGCQRNMTDSGELSSDDQLIMSIQNASDKQEIDTDQLPSASREVLERDYVEHITVGASMAPELGYEVLLGGMESRMGDRSGVYFDLEGRELRSSGRARDEDENDREQCFELVSPMTFIMPDYSTISIDNEESIQIIDEKYVDAFHDREIVLYGKNWLFDKIKKYELEEITLCFLKDL